MLFRPDVGCPYCEISHQATEIERLRAALEKISRFKPADPEPTQRSHPGEHCYCGYCCCIRVARQALGMTGVETTAERWRCSKCDRMNQAYTDPCPECGQRRAENETEPVQAKVTLNPDALISTTRCNYCMGARYVTVQRSVVPLTSRVGSGPVFVSEPCPMCNAEPL